jgi:four helix bundle protein
VKDFRNLKVWDKAHSLTLDIYRTTGAFPREELYGITSQMRRASSSVAANIAEGYGRGGDGDFHRFLNTAAGSVVELEYFLLLSRDLGMLSEQCYDDLQSRVAVLQRMLSGLLRTVADTRSKASNKLANCPELVARS